MRLALLLAVPLLAALQSAALAMPTIRYDADKTPFASYQMNVDGWAALSNDPVYRASFSALFSPRPMLDIGNMPLQALQALPDRTLTRHERRAMQSLYESLSRTANEAGPTGSPADGDVFGAESGTGTGDLLGELRRSVDALYASATRDNPPLGTPDAAATVTDPAGATANGTYDFGAGDIGRGGAETIVIHPRAAATEATLLDMPLGSLGVEAMRPVLKITDMMAGALTELRQYVLIEQPKSSLMMMMDGGSNQAIVLQTNGGVFIQANHPDRAASLGTPLSPHTVGPGGGSEADFLNKSLKELLWDISTSNAAIVLYFLIFACWLAWHYFISRHV